MCWDMDQSLLGLMGLMGLRLGCLILLRGSRSEGDIKASQEKHEREKS